MYLLYFNATVFYRPGSSVGIGTSMSNITRDLRDLSTAGFIQNFQSLLKEGETARYSKEEQSRICWYVFVINSSLSF